jgi:hypothetical protein
MKQILLLGDSIRMYYQDKVKEKLGEKFNVVMPKENCRFSNYTLNSIRLWMSEFPDPDIIHWNNGLWDVAHINDEDFCFCPIKDYLSNMERIFRFLKNTTKAKIILATTTPTRKEKESHPTSKHFVEEIILYNKALIERFEGRVAAIDDLFGIVIPELDKMICEDYIHLTEYGKESCSQAVCKSILGI